ncbi:kinase-like domain-containing protein [Irpex rosettiformis]|uniref:Kinase-like domain-containing protein n=1 Tax=Irpex rosettiformis TaxID=378272 RepID=A0ACB8U360_9APHY|nr:kinase-like domain-containing protein [Irpex rosettiformis]
MPCNIPAAKLTGTTIDGGRFKLLEPLGRGSGGVVFRTLNTVTQAYYAVKCVHKAQKGTRQYTFQQRELRFHRTVSHHNNVITLHRIIEEEPYIFLVMDLCSGGDLFKFLTEKGIFRRNTQMVKSVFVQLIDAVDACHRSGIYHRDIKPENIMCNEDGTQVMLGDFGLSTDTKWSKNFGAGTSAYMSPECIGVVGGMEAYSSPSNDIWSLGVILTSMISGHNPWRQAVMSDDCFRTYVNNPGFFRYMLPISPSADTILRRIFTNHDNRISLRKLRRMVLAVDTFFMTDEEIAGASAYVQAAAAAYLYEGRVSSSQHGKSLLGGNDDLVVEEVAISHKDEPNSSESVDLHPFIEHPKSEARSRFSTLISSDVSDLVNTASGNIHKKPAPRPQRMPSYNDLMGTGVDDLEKAHGRTKGRRTCGSDSPVSILRRWMERIFV